MKQKYKVTLFTNWFDVPTALSCENMITYSYIVAANVSEVKERINKKFKGRKEIIKIDIMTQYIDKSAVVAEIEKLQESIQKTAVDDSISEKNAGMYRACVILKDFLDSLGVKEVDLNREIEKEIETRWRGEYLFTTKFKESAKHFFELGLKAQKGE